MNLTNRGRLYLLIGLISFIFSYLIVTLNFFPHLGFAASFIIFILVTYKFKKEKSGETKIFFTFAMVFSALLLVRSEPFITFLNFGAALFFGSFMLALEQKNNLGFIDHVYAPISFFAKSVFSKSDYYLEFKQKKENFKTVKIVEIVFGTLMSLLLLAIILPLLSSANPFFQKLVTDFLSFFNLENLLKLIGLQTFFVWTIRLVFFLGFIFIIPKILTLVSKSNNFSLPQSFKVEALPLIIPKVVLTIILVVFFITQLQFYFASDEVLSNMGVTYSQRAREVFAQLSLVAAITLLLIYNDRVKSKLSKSLNWILGLQGIFLTAMAYKSDFEYINAWGLTYIRLYGLTLATWITGIFILFFVNYRNGESGVKFVKNTIVFSAFILFLANVLNYDYLIYHFRKAATGQGVDYTYLSTLSPDSLSYYDQISKLAEVTEKGEYTIEEYNNKNPLIIIYKIEYLQRKYSKLDLRTLNLLDYLQYQEIKSVDTKSLRTYYDRKPR